MIKPCLGILLFLWLNFANAEPLTKVRVALDWYINPDHAPLLVAQTYGYFRQEGLEVEFLEPSNTASARNLVLSRQADIGIDYQPETMMAISQGLPLKVIGNLVPTPLSCMAVLTTSPITKFQDLAHKTIGYMGDPLEAAVIDAGLRHAGMTSDTVKLLAVHMDLVQVLLAQQVDAVNGFMRNVEPIELKAEGINTRLFFPEQNGVPSYAELTFLVNPKTSNKLVLQKFIHAVEEGEMTLAKDPEAAWQKVVAAYPEALASSKQIRAINHLIWQASVPYFTADMTEISTKSYRDFNAFMVHAGLLKQPLPLKAYFLAM